MKLGRLLVQSQKFDEAVGIHQKIYELQPHDPRNSNSLGVTLMIAGYQKQAIEYLGKAASLDPKNLVFKANLGKAHMMARQWSEALKCFDSLIASPGFHDSGQIMELRQECLANLPAIPKTSHDAGRLKMTDAESGHNAAANEEALQEDTVVDEQTPQPVQQASHESGSLSIVGAETRDAASEKQDTQKAAVNLETRTPSPPQPIKHQLHESGSLRISDAEAWNAVDANAEPTKGEIAAEPVSPTNVDGANNIQPGNLGPALPLIA
jgi:tetratricopeptide (TPR) repeat protein